MARGAEIFVAPAVVPTPSTSPPPRPSSGADAVTDGMDALFTRLARSRFRRRFRLRGADLAYLRDRGLPAVMEHAARFVAERLAPAEPPNDGRQTPWRGHPVFVAQHATGTCCRGCLERWHGIPRGVPLGPEERERVLAALERWLREQADAAPSPAPPEQISLWE